MHHPQGRVRMESDNLVAPAYFGPELILVKIEYNRKSPLLSVAVYFSNFFRNGSYIHLSLVVWSELVP